MRRFTLMVTLPLTAFVLAIAAAGTLWVMERDRDAFRLSIRVLVPEPSAPGGDRDTPRGPRPSDPPPPLQLELVLLRGSRVISTARSTDGTLPADLDAFLVRHDLRSAEREVKLAAFSSPSVDVVVDGPARLPFHRLEATLLAILRLRLPAIGLRTDALPISYLSTPADLGPSSLPIHPSAPMDMLFHRTLDGPYRVFQAEAFLDLPVEATPAGVRYLGPEEELPESPFPYERLAHQIPRRVFPTLTEALEAFPPAERGETCGILQVGAASTVAEVLGRMALLRDLGFEACMIAMPDSHQPATPPTPATGPTPLLIHGGGLVEPEEPIGESPPPSTSPLPAVPAETDLLDPWRDEARTPPAPAELPPVETGGLDRIPLETGSAPGFRSRTRAKSEARP